MLAAQVGTEKIIVPAGGTALLPAGLPHRWRNAGDDLLEFSGQVAPAVDLDRYLQAVFAVLNASSNGRPSIFPFAHVLLVPSRHTVAFGSAPSHSADRFACHSLYRTRPGQISWIEPARFSNRLTKIRRSTQTHHTLKSGRDWPVMSESGSHFFADRRRRMMEGCAVIQDWSAS